MKAAPRCRDRRPFGAPRRSRRERCAGARQGLVLAYEPVWAIGSGLTPTPADVAQVHAMLRAELARRFGEKARATRILYGGSVAPRNAAGLLKAPGVDGALVGGASLKALEFLSIAKVYLET